MQLSWFTWWEDPRSDCCGLIRFNSLESLQTDPELTLDKVVTMARQTKAVRETAGSGKAQDRQHFYKN